jgi:acid phosphatase type 7
VTLRKLTVLLFILPVVVPVGGRSATAGTDPVIEVAGDIACAGLVASRGTCHEKATADILMATSPTLILALGDNQYDQGSLRDFSAYFGRTWGQLKARIRPVPGNHEYATPGASGYFSYFGALAGSSSRGYYSYNLGAWHILALNSAIPHDASSSQYAWLKSDLLAHPNLCTLAYWHHPRWSSGEHGNNLSMDAFWRLLSAHHVDVVLNGHDHDYERFNRQAPDGTPTIYGIREFVVGTGGMSHYSFQHIQANSRVRNSDTFGVLRLGLHPTSYSWNFLPEAGKTFTDHGWSYCN